MTELELETEIMILRVKNEKLQKEIRELKHVRMLDLSEIVSLRRQIELLTQEGETNEHSD